jgi:putative oxidoreductase
MNDPYNLWGTWSRILAATRNLDWFPPLLARVTLGVLFLSTGWGKVHHLDRVILYFGELGIPAPVFNATLVAWTELVCGSLLLAGLFSRMAATPLIVSMTVALATAKAPYIHGLADLFGQVEFTYIVLLVLVVIGGPGAISLDTLFVRFLKLRSKGRLGS